MKALKKAATIFVSIILWAIIIVAALFTFTTMATRDQSHVANVAGFTPLTVQSDSMAPVFYAGDLIFIHTCDAEDLEVGDIVCFHTIIENQYALNTHRIAEIEEGDGYISFVTKGDNNLVSDQHVITGNDVVGKYVGKVSNLGKFMDFLSSSLGFLLVIILPLLIFFVYQVYHLVMVGIAVKKANALEAAQSQAEMISDDVRRQAEDNEKLKSEAERAKAEAEAALEEAKRLRAEAEAKLAEANEANKKADTEE